MRLYLIRHAQSTNNALTDYRLRTYDPDLTPEGYQQAQLLANYLSKTSEIPEGTTGLEHGSVETVYRFTHLYVSPMHRTLLTALPIAKAFGLKPEVMVDLHEVGGLFEESEEDEVSVIKGYPGLSQAEMIERFPDYMLPEDVTHQGWWNVTQGRETVDAFLARAIRVVIALRKRATTDDHIALVTHGAFMSVLIKGLFDQLPGHADDLFYAHYNTAITRIDFNEGIDKIRLHYLNRMEHLPLELRTW